MIQDLMYKTKRIHMERYRHMKLYVLKSAVPQNFIDRNAQWNEIVYQKTYNKYKIVCKETCVKYNNRTNQEFST